MTEPEQQAPTDPHEGIDAANNADARDRETNQSAPIARASAGGLPPVDAPPHNTAPVVEGTGAGDPLAGVHIDEQDAATAVSGDDGPEHGGVRRSS